MPLINGTSGDDSIIGTAGNDTITGGGGGFDTLLGGDGNDFIDATGSAARFEGGSGDDTIISTAGSPAPQVHIYSGTGDDLIELNMSTVGDYNGEHDPAAALRFSGHHVFGESGNDTFNFVYDPNENKRIVGRIDDFDLSRDTIQVNGQSIDLFNLPSNVRIVELHGQQWILIDERILYTLEGARTEANSPQGVRDGEERHFVEWPAEWVNGVPASADVSFIDQRNFVPGNFQTEDAIWGDGARGPLDNADTIIGTSGDDIINSNKANDSVRGGNGDDSIAGGLDNDTVRGDNGNDVIYGGSEDDRLYGNNGNDTLEGGTGYDRLYGGNNDDRLIDDHGNDRLFGGSGNDHLSAGRGNDRLYGGDGNDSLDAGSGNDKLYDGNGNDTLKGGDGNDKLYFGDGASSKSGWGDDVAFGGGGADRFIFSGTSGFTSIRDFEDGVDKIEFNGTDVESMNDLVITDQPWRNSVKIEYEGGVIRLENTSISEISVDDFIF